MTSPDPIEAAFQARGHAAQTGLDVDASLSDLHRRSARAAARRQGALAVLVVGAIGLAGVAATQRGDSVAEVATAPVETAPNDTSPSASTADDAQPDAPTTDQSLPDGATTIPGSSIPDSSTPAGGSNPGDVDADSGAAGDDGTSAEDATTTAPDSPEGTPIVVDQTRWRVVDVAANDRLTVRSGAGPSTDPIGEVGPFAVEVIATGDGVESASGAQWFEIEFGSTTGWVNARFLTPMGAGSGFDDVPCSLGDDALDAGVPTGPFPAPAGQGGALTVVAIDRLDGLCERTVITLDADEFAPGTTATVGTVDSATASVVVELPGLEWAEVDQSPAGDVVIARHGGNAGGLYAELLGRRGSSRVRYLTDPARIVIDHRPGVGSNQPVSSTVLDDYLIVRSFRSADAAAGDHPAGVVSMPATVTGWARPFEAQFSVAVLDAADNPIQVSWDGGIGGPTLASSYGVGTTDWTTAFGAFSFSIDDLDPGSYRLRFTEYRGDEDVNYDLTFDVVD